MSGDVPTGWHRRKLGAMCEILIGGTPSRNNPAYWAKSGEQGHAWASIADLKDPKVSQTKEMITESGVKNSNVKLLRPGTVMMSFKLTIGRVAIAGKNMYTNEAIAGFVPYDNSIIADYLNYALPFVAEEAETDQAVKGNTLNKAKLSDLEFLLPPLPEQRRIAEILSSVDEAIQATQAVIEQTRKVKQGVLQRLLTRGIGHTHFKVSDAGQIPQSWKVVRIAEVATAKGGKRMPKGRPFASEPTPHPYIRVSDLKNGTISSSNLMYVLPEDQKEIKNYTIASNDVYISIAGTIGLSGTVPPELDGAQLTENAAKLVIKNQRELDHEFLARLMQSETIQRQIVSAKGIGGGVPKLALFRIEQMFIPLPPIDEQIEIRKFARVIDAEIEAQENILSRVLSIKSALVSDLLTGRRRVASDLPLAAE